MQFTGFPAEFQLTIQSIDTWFINRKIGMLFEANVLNGKLIMTSMDITSKPEKRVVARQMHKAILDYMNSDAFRPTDEYRSGADSGTIHQSGGRCEILYQRFTRRTKTEIT